MNIQRENRKGGKFGWKDLETDHCRSRDHMDHPMYGNTDGSAASSGLVY